MAFIYNKEIFQKAGLDPNKGPETWEDVKNFAKQIKDKTGKAGFGMVAKLNNGNIPYRYMPLTWAYGGAALDETADNPTYQKSQFDSAGNIQALQWMLRCLFQRRRAAILADEHADRGARPLHLRRSGDDDRPPGPPTPMPCQGAGRRGENGLRADAEGAGAPRGRLRRLEHVHLQEAKDMDAVKAVVQEPHLALLVASG